MTTSPPPANLPVYLSFGLGVDSATILVEWLVNPASRNFPLSDLTVVTSMVGNEFPDSKRLVETHLLPLMRKLGVRFVQVGRTGPTKKEWAVLSDSRETEEVFVEGGGFTLGEELLVNGTVPQVGGTRKCSLKFKGDVLDPWFEVETGGKPFRHVMGFNAEEMKRVVKDKSFSRASRHSEYPLVEWGWGREKCETYLEDWAGEPWAKSCCTFCPFANNQAGLPAHVERLRGFPEVTADAMLMERVAEALNPRQSLFVGKHDFQAVVENNGLTEAQAAFERKLEEKGWALYRVRRIWSSVSTAQRSLVTEATGTREEMDARLDKLAAELGVEVTEAKRTRAARLSNKPETVDGPEGKVFTPGTEEFFVVAPAVVKDKQAKTFETKWAAKAPKRHLPVAA